MDAISIILLTGVQQKALELTELRKERWHASNFKSGPVFEKLWQEGLRLYDEQVGIDRK